MVDVRPWGKCCFQPKKCLHAKNGVKMTSFWISPSGKGELLDLNLKFKEQLCRFCKSCSVLHYCPRAHWAHRFGLLLHSARALSWPRGQVGRGPKGNSVPWNSEGAIKPGGEEAGGVWFLRCCVWALLSGFPGLLSFFFLFFPSPIKLHLSWLAGFLLLFFQFSLPVPAEQWGVSVRVLGFLQLPTQKSCPDLWVSISLCTVAPGIFALVALRLKRMNSIAVASLVLSVLINMHIFSWISSRPWTFWIYSAKPWAAYWFCSEQSLWCFLGAGSAG